MNNHPEWTEAYAMKLPPANDPESIHYQESPGPCRPHPGCGCAYCRPQEGPQDAPGREIAAALVILLTFTLGLAAGLWYAACLGEIR